MLRVSLSTTGYLLTLALVAAAAVAIGISFLVSLIGLYEKTIQ